MTQEQDSKNLHDLVDRLLEHADSEHVEFLSHTLENLITIQKENPNASDLRLVQTSLDEMVQSLLVFKEYRDHRKVCIFGSARTPADHPNFQLAEETARQVTKAGMMVITGAGPGIMEAGNKGAQESDLGFGLNILLPFEQSANPYILGNEKLINYRYFFARKLTFIKESDAVVLFPGGFGTHDEGFETLTLIQTGRCSPRPCLLINFDDSNYWESWRTYIKNQLLDRKYISPEDMDLFKEVSSAEEIVSEIQHFYSTYHSIKYTEDYSSIRLNTALKPELLDAINSKFSHLNVNKGQFKQYAVSELDKDNELYLDKHRLIFEFNRTNFGGLSQLINYINDNN